MVNAQNYVFYFESDIVKVFPFRPTCSSYDSEIKIKSKGAEKDQQRKCTNVKLGITAYMYVTCTMHIKKILISLNLNFIFIFALYDIVLFTFNPFRREIVHQYTFLLLQDLKLDFKK